MSSSPAPSQSTHEGPLSPDSSQSQMASNQMASLSSPPAHLNSEDSAATAAAAAAASNPGSPDSGAPLPPEQQDSIITLQVCEQRFSTYKQTLIKESHYFNSLLSGQFITNKQPDESYFIDADPDTFQHLLAYLRTHTLPLFYTMTGGHEFGNYAALYTQADFFGIERLKRWIKDKEYLQAVKVETTAAVREGIGAITGSTVANKMVEFHPMWRARKIYLCPRGIGRHTDPSDCGIKCGKARGDGEVEFEDEEFLSVVEVCREVVFRQDVCVEGRGEM